MAFSGNWVICCVAAPIFGAIYVLRRAFQEGYLFEVGRAVVIAGVSAGVVICAVAFEANWENFFR